MKVNYKKTNLKKGIRTFNALKKEAEKKGFQGMSLDKINNFYSANQ